MQSFFVFLILVSTITLQAQNNSNEIKGIVTSYGAPLPNANISIKGTSSGIQTDVNGKYQIEANPRDILVFSYVGMKPVEIIVEDVTRTLNIQLFAEVQELDEVTISKRKKITQEDLATDYYTDGSIINTDFGYLNPKLVGYELRIIDGKNLNTKAIDILDAIVEELPGITVRSREGVRYLFTSSVGSLRGGIPVAYELDGHIRKPENAPVQLDINKVVRIGIIPKDQAARRYGGIAAGGMVVINTFDIDHSSGQKENRPFDQIRLKNNIYSKDAIDETNVVKNSPTYFKKLLNSKNANEAYQVYENYVGNFNTNYSFLIDTYRCLSEKFKNERLSDKILTEHSKSFKEDPVAMKALAYVHQNNSKFKSANRLYKELFVMRPDYIQSYLDLANSYIEVEEYERSLQIYTRLNYLLDQGYFSAADSLKVITVLARDLNNLVTLHGNTMLSKDRKEKENTVEEDFTGTRLVFEWNDSEAEFELQFVNPEGRYFKMERSLFAVGNQIQEQNLMGYATEEFLIDDTNMNGTWQVNMKYLGNKKLKPSYLKAVVYYNYGTIAQYKETKVFKMQLKNVNQELFKIDNNDKRISLK
ncbi:carboxypeptidase-like regulatory domain-containing protein [Maribacter sp. LLG6340-A2]|uniref:carboxypeptidase-like regulatory domain-containing protein n=1 Tax=Maribacter sp. LLG6340-A2 TaxID=3160834 RepID=UPI00386A10CB